MQKVLVLHPRLDVPFKKTEDIIPSKNYSNLIPIRKHWQNFYTNLIARHMGKKDSVTIVELPLWQFDDGYLRSVIDKYDLIYVPHKTKKDYTVQSDNLRFVMQTVFPDYFTIDKNGWGASLSYLPIDMNCGAHVDYYSMFKARAAINVSKFEQPMKSTTFPYTNYILFVCQIPHDEVIKNYSKVSVIEALHKVLEFGQLNAKNVLVKGHPVNPGSMYELAELTEKYDCAKYVDNISIHDALNNANSVVMVNSGVAFEAMLYNKRIFRFGDAEYRQVVPEFSEQNYYNYEFNFDDYRKFINCFFELAHR